MANTKQTIIDSLVTNLAAITGVNKVTDFHDTPDRANNAAPYIGVIQESEDFVVEDATHIRQEMVLDLLIVQRQAVGSINDLVDAVKEKIYSPVSIGALMSRVDTSDKVSNLDELKYSNVRLIATILYVVEKGDI